MKRRYTRSATVTLVWLAGLTAGHAQDVCTKPTASSCATEKGPFPRDVDYDDCRKQMIDYKARMENYVSCLEKSEWPTDALIASTELESTPCGLQPRARGEQD